jgi:UDPglucose 6-dehydrogenase
MELTFLGAGHVGLVSAACMSSIGHRARVFDIDRDRIASLGRGEIPFFEPGLEELFELGLAEGQLSFHHDPKDALRGAELIFVCVGTQPGPYGDVDLSGVVGATIAAARHADAGSVLVNRSTAPVGTAEYIRSIVDEECQADLAVAVNPEFLAEGRAVRDFLVPDRIVVGAWDPSAIDRVVAAYEPIIHRRLPSHVPDVVRAAAEKALGTAPIVTSRPATAELTKYAANAFLAVKISFINEIAGIAEETGADVTEVARAVGLDHRIGSHFLQAGIGWGGSCFPKDIVALEGMARAHGLDGRMLRAANDVNLGQQRWVAHQLQRCLKTLYGRRVGLLGLSFKPETDDLRNAPALEIATELTRLGARVRAYDPAVRSLPPEHAQHVELTTDPTEIARNADALVLVTEWPEFARFDLDALRRLMRTPLLLDGRNFLDPETARRAGFVYLGVGRQTEAPYVPALLHELVPLMAGNDGVAHPEPASQILAVGGT